LVIVWWREWVMVGGVSGVFFVSSPGFAGSGSSGARPGTQGGVSRRLQTGTEVARPWAGTDAPPEKIPRACGQRPAAPGHVGRGRDDLRSGGRGRSGLPPPRPDRRRVGAGRASFVTGDDR